MEPVLWPDIFVFCSLQNGKKIPDGINLQAFFQEKEGATLILREDEAKNLGLDYQFPSRMITLNVHSALDAVGFMAFVSTKLAENGISVNPVSAFYHDHLFVSKDVAEKSLGILLDLSEKSKET